MDNANRSSSHAVYNIKLHIVFVTKYRRKTLTPELLAYLETAFAEILTAWRCRLIAFGGEPDHVHRVLPVSLREFQRPVRYGVSPAYWVKPRPRADADGDGQPGKNGWSG